MTRLARIHRLLPSRAAPDGCSSLRSSTPSLSSVIQTRGLDHSHSASACDDEMGERQAGWTPVERRPARQRAQMGTHSRHESVDPGLAGMDDRNGEVVEVRVPGRDTGIVVDGNSGNIGV